MALILGDQAAKDPAAAAGPVTGSSSSSQDILESTDKKRKMGGLSLAESKEQEAPEAVNTLLSNGLAESKGLSYETNLQCLQFLNIHAYDIHCQCCYRQGR
jgi:hypothetical protein